MLPLGDFTRPRQIPFVTGALVVANTLVWLAYELPHGVNHSVVEIGFRPCAASGRCTADGVPWPAALITSMFGHGSWAHLVGNMVFLLVFGPAVEDALGKVRYLTLYVIAGLAAGLTHAVVMLSFSPQDAVIPAIGASGAISGVLAAYVVVRPFRRVLVWVMPAFFLRIPALAVLGAWFLLQAVQGSMGLVSPQHSSVAFFAHVGGFVAGLVLATAWLDDSWPRAVIRGGRPRPV